MKPFKIILVCGLITATLLADSATRTNISFVQDEDGNLNPSIFIPMYYGENNKFYSGIGYTSATLKEIGKVDNFSDSKNALVSTEKAFTINYITYQTSLLHFDVSIGLQSTFSKYENNGFGYIHDSQNLFGNGSNYYIAFDNEIELDVKRHAINADILLPYGDYFKSRFSTSISPYTSVSVKQTTIFKPLVNATGRSSSSTVQDIAYSFRYEAQVKTGTFIDIGLEANYNNQPLKYDIAQLGVSGSSYVFNTANVDINEVTTSYIVRLIFNKKMLGGINPSIGYGLKNIDSKNNLTGKTTSVNKTIIAIGVEKRF